MQARFAVTTHVTLNDQDECSGCPFLMQVEYKFFCRDGHYAGKSDCMRPESCKANNARNGS